MSSAKASFFLLLSALFISVGLSAVEQQIHQKIESSLPNIIDNSVLKIISSTQSIPGLHAEEWPILKEGISTTWNRLFEEGALEITGTDKDVRPYFVAIQGIVEHVLASELQQNVKTLKGVIHTPMPATPLCTKGDISQDLVDPSIASDPARLFTVKARTTILRDYLFKGGDLYIVYPKDGYGKRTEEQQKIYKQELINYPNHLFDVPLNCENIPTELIGATYLFQDHLGNQFVFAIKMTQAKDPQDIGNFGLCFGAMHHPAIQKRVQAVSAYMEQNDINILKQ